MTGQDATAVYCRETNPKGSWYDHGAAADALFDLTDGVSMTYRGSWAAEGANTAWEASWRVIGTRGTLLWDGNEGFDARVVDGTQGFLRPLRPIEVPELPPQQATAHAGVLVDFVSAVQSGSAPLTPAPTISKASPWFWPRSKARRPGVASPFRPFERQSP